MSLPYPIDPSLPSNPSPLFSDSTAARGDHLRANNSEIWANFDAIVSTILGGASLSTDGTMAANSDTLFASQKALVTYVLTKLNLELPVGFEGYWPGVTPPTNWMVKDGSNLLRSSYTSLFAALCPATSGLTMTAANPCVLTLAGHGLQSYQCVSLETTGALLSAFTAGSSYYVHKIDVNTFHLCASIAHVTTGTYISTATQSQSGTHTLRYSSYGTADITHFYLPDDRGIHIVGVGTQGTASGWAGSLSNHIGISGYYNEDGFQTHIHGITGYTRSGAVGNYNIVEGRLDATERTAAGGGAIGTFSDGTHGTPRGGGLANAGYITSPARVGHLPIIKYQ